MLCAHQQRQENIKEVLKMLNKNVSHVGFIIKGIHTNPTYRLMQKICLS